MKNLEQKFVKIVEKLQTKDLEIEVLNEEVKSAYFTIRTLSQRISDLEKSINITRDTTANPVTPVVRGERSLLLGDTNLQRAKPSDIENYSIRTIRGATSTY